MKKIFAVFRWALPQKTSRNIFNLMFCRVRDSRGLSRFLYEFFKMMNLSILTKISHWLRVSTNLLLDKNSERHSENLIEGEKLLICFIYLKINLPEYWNKNFSRNKKLLNFSQKGLKALPLKDILVSVILNFRKWLKPENFDWRSLRFL